MSVADTLQTPKRELLCGEFDHQSSRRSTEFYRSLRSKDYIFLVLLLAYLVLATVFFFSQREKTLSRLDESRNEIERLIAANQVRMNDLIREYRYSGDQLGIKFLALGMVGLIQIDAITTEFCNHLKSDLLRLQQRTAEIVRSYNSEIHAVATPGGKLKIVIDFPVEKTSLNVTKAS
jgi:hypothetical protein